MPRLTNTPKLEDRCKALKQDGSQCPMPVENNKSYCPAYHKEYNEYTQDQIETIKRCTKCKNYKPFDLEERHCIQCTEKNGSNKIKPPKIAKVFASNCMGKGKQGKCGQKALVDSKYCTYHKHWEKFTQDQMDRIDKCKKCEKYEPIVPNSNQRCETHCYEKQKHIDGAKMNKVPKPKISNIYECKGYAENKERCRYTIIDGESFCKHHVDMKDYTEDMLNINNQKLCKQGPRNRWRYFPGADRCEDCQIKDNTKPKCRGLCANGTPCKLYQKYDQFCHYHKDMREYTEDMLADLQYCKGDKHYRYCGEYKTCIHCRNVGKKNRVKVAEEKSKIPRCLKCNNAQVYGNYCGDHKLQDYIEQVRSSGREPCANYNRRCKETLAPDYPYTRCDNCLKKARDNDRKRYTDRQENIANQRELLNYEVSMCMGCDIVHPMHMFIIKGQKNYSYYCNYCREYDRANVNMYTRRNTWTDAKTYREYIRRAERKDFEFTITKDEFMGILRTCCNYCGIIETKTNDNGMIYNNNGIDRYDNDKGYIITNCVPCCTMCNYMKYTHGGIDFINYCQNIYKNYGCEKITTYQTRHKRYCEYKYDAERRGKDFDITEDQFVNILKKACYYCANLNGTDQIGIDRYDSEIGYSDEHNKLVACCKICNMMKKDYHADEFYNKIINILLYNKKITEDEYTEAKKDTEPKTDLSRLIRRIKDTLSYEDEKDPDRRNIMEFNHDHTYYTRKIWDSFDVTQLKPEIVFCETDEEHDIWMYYRLIVSSHIVNSKKDTVGCNIRILIRDKFTQKYLGIAELSSTVYSCSLLDDEIGWTTKIKKTKINNVLNISICVALPPFSHNFNGGKLITKLMFSREIYDYYQKLYGVVLAGIITYSLHGESVQYSDLPELKYLGLTSGYSLTNCKMSRGIINKVNVYLENWGKPASANNLHNLSNFCEHLNIRDVTSHDKRRGVYFGYTASKSKEFLTTNECDINTSGDDKSSSIDNRTEIINESDMKDVNIIGEEWIIIALDRFNELLKCSTDIDNDRGLRFKIDYDYDAYYVDNKGKDRNRKKQRNNVHDTKNQDYLSRVSILKDWNADNTKTFQSMADSYNMPTRKIKSIIFGKSQVTDDLKTSAKELSIARLKKYSNIKRNKIIDANHIVKDLVLARKKVFDIKNEQFNFEMKKSNLNFLRYDRNQNNNSNTFIKFEDIENVIKGKWRINKRSFGENRTIVDIQSDTYDKDLKHVKRTVTFAQDNHLVQCIGLYQSNVTKVDIDDHKIYSSPFKITTKQNLFLSLVDKQVTNIKIIYFYRKNDEHKKIIRILIEEDSYDSKDNIDVELDDLIDIPIICEDSECFCKFKSIVMRDDSARISIKKENNVEISESKKKIARVRKNN